jgi:hypothetical protein
MLASRGSFALHDSSGKYTHLVVNMGQTVTVAERYNNLRHLNVARCCQIALDFVGMLTRTPQRATAGVIALNVHV